jgi:hypothetical protein
MRPSHVFCFSVCFLHVHASSAIPALLINEHMGKGHNTSAEALNLIVSVILAIIQSVRAINNACAYVVQCEVKQHSIGVRPPVALCAYF